MPNQNVPRLFADLAYAYGRPKIGGQIRVQLEDFRVKEQLKFSPNGEGEHVFLQIEKRGENTDFVCRKLSAFANVPSRDIGYAGLKDRNAVTVQWFSVRLAGKTEPDWNTLNSDCVRVLKIRRNTRKLRRGALQSNKFEIVVDDLIEGNCQDLDERLCRISVEGVPNYFGPQRFGRDQKNIVMAKRLFDGSLEVRDRYRRGLYLSAIRSYLFNQVLSLRVEAKSWNMAIPGDALILDGTHSFFKPESLDQRIHHRVQTMDLHPSGFLWGKGDNPVTDQALGIEQHVVDGNPLYRDGLKKFGLMLSRRSLRLTPKNVKWNTLRPRLKLNFELPPGCYATSVLREIVNVFDT